MAVILVEGITDRLALEAVAGRLGVDLGGVAIVPIGGAQAVRRAAAEYEGEHVVGLCDAGEERYFRRVLGDATFVCRRTSRTSCSAPSACRASRSCSKRRASSRRSATSRTSPHGAAARRRRDCRAGSSRPTGRRYRYLPLLVEMLEPDEIPAPLVGVLAAVCALSWKPAVGRLPQCPGMSPEDRYARMHAEDGFRSYPRAVR